MSTNIKVMHVIDSLELGGAERVAVNLSNALADAGIETHLCVTRKDGPLRGFISDKVNFLMLGKKNIFDISAYIRLRKYITRHNINVIHAHSSSVFLAALAMPRRTCVLVWHSHYGKAVERRPDFWLFSIKKRINYVFTVNNDLRQWAICKVGFKESQVEYLRNYPDLNHNDTLLQPLPGERKYKIAHIAGLRPQKDHFTLLRAAKELPECDFYCVGNDFNDDYSRKVHSFIKNESLRNVYLLGARTDVAAILRCCDIGVLSSESEGLPVSLLEYGLMELPVVCTKVGECPAVLGDGKYGMLVKRGDSRELAEILRLLLSDENMRMLYAKDFNQHIKDHYSKKVIISHIIDDYIQLLKKRGQNS